MTTTTKPSAKVVAFARRQFHRIDTETVRPYRIWDSVEKREIAHRCYSDERRALDSALLLVRWEQVGRTLEVYDVTTGRWLGTYKRGVNFIEITAPKRIG